MRAFAPLLLATCFVAACSDRSEPAPAADAAAPATTEPAGVDPAAATDNAGVTMRYACDAGTTVTVLEDGTARVALADGQEVTVSRIAGSAPPVFSGGSIFFTVGEDGARLSQDDEANELACTAA